MTQTVKRKKKIPGSGTDTFAWVEDLTANINIDERPVGYDPISFGADPTGVSDSHTAFEAILALCANDIVTITKGTYKISGDLTFPSNATLIFGNGAKLSIDSGKVVTINGNIEAGIGQIFSGSGTVNFGNEVLRPDGTFTSSITLAKQPAEAEPIKFVFSTIRGHTPGTAKDIVLLGTDLADNVLLESLEVAEGAITVTSLGFFKTLTTITLEAGFDVTDNVLITSNTVNTKLENIYPQWWGATGDGVTNDTVAMQAAITATNTVGGTIFLVSGTYLTAQLIMKSNVNIIGAGWKSILKLRNGTNGSLLFHAYTENINNIRIANLTIDGNKANNTGGSGTAFGGSNIVVEGCYVHDTAHAGIMIGSSIAGGGKIRILNNWCHNPALAGNWWGAFAVTGGDDVIISGNIATEDDGFMAYGIDIEPNLGWVVSNVVIENNIIRDGGIIVTGRSGIDGTVTNVKITGNAIRRNNPTYDVHAPIYVNEALGIVSITDNDVGGPATIASCLWIDGMSGVFIANNRITNNGVGLASTSCPSIYLRHTSHSFILNNILYAPVAVAGGGMYEAGTSHHNSYSGNQFYQIGDPHITLLTPLALEGRQTSVQALDATGLTLYDDGGNGIAIADGGDVTVLAGQLGIGKVPSKALDVYKTVSADINILLDNPNSGSAARSIIGAKTNATLQLMSYGDSYTSTPNLVSLYGSSANTEMRLTQSATAPMTLYTNATERIRILSTGQTGFGFTTPGAKVAINGGLSVGDETDPGDNNIRVVGAVIKSVVTSITASVTQTQAGGVALTADINVVTVCANANDTVVLPTAVTGRQVYIFNKGAQNLRVFPASGDDLGAGADTYTATPIATGKHYTYTAYDTTNWIETVLN